MAGTSPAMTNATNLLNFSAHRDSAAAASCGTASNRRHGAILGKARRALVTLGAFAGSLARALKDLPGDQACVLANGALDLLGHVRMLFQILLGVLASLADALRIEGEPGA